MLWIDYAILGVIGLSALISVVRGFIKEALSLIGWIAAIWIGLAFSEDLAVLLEDKISVPSVRMALAFSALFIATLLLTGLIIYLVGLLVQKTGLSGTDRMLGVIFGVARGSVIVGILVLLAGLTPLPDDPWWRESVLVPHFERLAIEIRGLLPPDIARHFDFTPTDGSEA
ncbi:MAG: CvpA family protein [Gammaproteobacteria bacterium]|nr:CvpA family protein [Gammaproteobacteria bacterium]